MNTSPFSHPQSGVVRLLFLLLLLSGTVAAQAVKPPRDSLQPRLVLQLGQRSALCAAFSPMGYLLLTAGLDKSMVLWDVRSGKEIRRILSPAPVIYSVAFSSDGRHALSMIGGVIIWDMATGEPVLPLESDSEIWAAAYSADGKTIATAGDGEDIVLWDANTGEKIRSFAGHEERVVAIAFSPDGRFVLTGSNDHTAVLWDAATGRMVRRLTGHEAQVFTVAFSPDGRLIATGSFDSTVRLWEASTGREVRRLTGHTGLVKSLAFSPDGRWLATAAIQAEQIEVGKSAQGDNTLRVWEVATGKEAHRFEKAFPVAAFSPDGRVLVGGLELTLVDTTTWSATQKFASLVTPIGAVEYSPDGNKLTIGTGTTSNVWDLTSGRVVSSFQESPTHFTCSALSPDGRYAAVATNNSSRVRLLDADTGQEQRRFDMQTGNVAKLKFSPSGKWLLITNGQQRTVVVWDVASGTEVRRIPGVFFDISANEELLLTGNLDNELRLFNLQTGEELRRFAHENRILESFGFSPDGRYIISGATDSTLRLWETATGREIIHRRHTMPILSLAVSPRGGRYVAVGDANAEVSVWDMNTGTQVKQFAGHTMGPSAITFSPDEKLIVLGGPDGTTRIWSRATGAEVCVLVSFTDGSWLVVAPDGRFDTNNLETLSGIQWVMPDDPFKVLPLEIFMRDYYEPRLLPRLLNGEQFKEVRKLSELNRVQPLVQIVGIERQQDKPDMVTVTVEVAQAKSEQQRDKQGKLMQTGVYDLRLFRDGQIVGQWSDGKPQALPQSASDNEKLLAWRNEAQVKLDTNSKRTIKFENIKLPRKANLKQVEFSAYAFNEDRIISKAVPKTFAIPAGLTSLKGRAYLITVGVNAYQNSELDLRFAANDARRIQATLADRLAKSKQYDDIVQIPLISDYEIKDGQHVLTEKPGEVLATKNNFQMVLDLLAGRKVDEQLKSKIPNADKIRPARPEDLVMISFSSHGYADNDGNFYFILSDTGKSDGEPVSEALVKKLRPRFLSSEELSLWLRDVDAGEMLMIVDACHSAAAVQGQEFKPGPMGSRGLGQLSYDKGMRILTATQSADVAYGIGALKQGLLTYALVKDGLEEGQADFKPIDKSIMVSEWLQFGEQRVPKLFEELAGKAKASDAPVELKDLVQQLSKDLKTQRPSLFDFSRKRADVLLMRRP